MKNTIRNSVGEVYKETNNNDFSFNKDLMDNNNVINDNAMSSSKKANNLFNKIKSGNNSNKNSNSNGNSKKNTNSNTNNNSNKTYVNRNTTMKRNVVTETTEMIKTAQNGISSYVIIVMFLFIITLIGVFVFFQETIMDYLKRLFNDEEKDKVINELSKSAEQDKERQIKLSDEIKSLKDEIAVLTTAKKEDKKEEDNNVKKPKPSKSILQQYSDSQILKNDGYCFVGSDNNIRHCVKAYEGEICSSGDIYNRIDECLVPGLRT